MKKTILGLCLLCLFACDKNERICNIATSTGSSSYLLINFKDKNTKKDLVFGNDKQFDLEDITISILDTMQQQKTWGMTKLEIRGDSTLGIGLVIHDEYIPNIQTVFIDYNQLYPNDTLNIEYALTGYCYDIPIKHDYNIKQNGEYLCHLCFQEPIILLK